MTSPHEPEDIVVASPQSQDIEMTNINPTNTDDLKQKSTDVVEAKPEHADLPKITVAFRDLTVTVKTNQNTAEIRNLFTPLVSLYKKVTTLGKSDHMVDLHRIKDVSGVLLPGTMTLVLSPPGHGKSSYLKAISSRIPLSSGQLSFNGYTPDEAEAEGVNVRKLTQYVDQVDCNIPLLTVHETLTFAHKTSSAFFDPKRVDATIALLGLEECRDTYIGSTAVRGVSGGQRRRVSIGEMLVSDARTIFLDEYTNGLDTATSEDITRGLRNWVNDTQGSIIVTLQQPTPGLYEMFDNIVLLRDAHVVYHGPRPSLVPFVTSMGFQAPDDVDVCDFLLDCLSHPRPAIEQQRKNGQYKTHSAIPDSERTTPEGQVLTLSSTPCVTTDLMVQHYKNSAIWKDMEKQLDVLMPLNSSGDQGTKHPIVVSPRSKKMYEGAYALPLPSLFAIVWARQAKIFIRDKPMLISRITMCIVMGLIYASLFFDLPLGDAFRRTAIFMIAVVQLSFVAITELPTAVEANVVVKRQVSSRFYPSSAFVTAYFSSLPFSVIEVAIFGSIIYFMSGQTLDVGVIFIYYLIMFLQGTMMSTYLRCISGLVDSVSAAEAMSAPIIGICLIFSNYFIPMDSLRVWIRWFIWLSPFSWSIRAMVINEFGASRYDTLMPNGQRMGDYLLDTVGMYTDHAWIWYCVIFLIGFIVVLACLHSFALNRKYHELSIGTRRLNEEEDEKELAHPEDEDDDDEESVDDVGIVVRKNQAGPRSGTSNNDAAPEPSIQSFVRDRSFSKTVLRTFRDKTPISPAWLSFKDITYTIQVTKNKQTVDRILLNGVSGYAEPGKLTALMGASGAGKTTLLDVLAGRKSSGRIDGSIKINGLVPTQQEFAAVTGYVEQFDSLLPFDTVYETLLFAARLRLPADVEESTKVDIVNEVMEILELTPIQDMIIGNSHIPGLSPSQLKRVNIGVELVCNPAILFLDEPTTGLDSHAAQTVMRAVRRIARSGRAIICTIHQPSAELFYLFDRLCLLGAGGHQIFFGDLGVRSRSFIKYLSSAPGVQPIRPRHNPASWMLEELGVGVASMKGPKDGEEPAAEQVVETPQEVILKYKRHYQESRVYAHFYSLATALDSLESIAKETDKNYVPGSNPLAISVADNVEEVTTEKPARRYSLSSNAGRFAAREMSFAEARAIPNVANGIVVHQRPSPGTQFRLLLERFFRAHFRNPSYVYSRVIVLLFVSLIFGCTYFDLEVNSQMTVLARMSSYIISALFFCYIHGSAITSHMMELRDVFYRERSSGYYLGVFWGVGFLIVEALYGIFTILICQIPFYFMSSMENDAGKFFLHYIAMYLYNNVFLVEAILFSALAPSLPLANILSSLMLSISFTFSGLAVFKPDIPNGYKWLFAAIPLRHVNEMITMSQLKCDPLPMCGPLVTIPTEIGNQDVPLALVATQMTGFSFDYFWSAFGWVCLYVVIVLVLGLICTHKLNHSTK